MKKFDVKNYNEKCGVSLKGILMYSISHGTSVKQTQEILTTLGSKAKPNKAQTASINTHSSALVRKRGEDRRRIGR